MWFFLIILFVWLLILQCNYNSLKEYVDKIDSRVQRLIRTKNNYLPEAHIEKVANQVINVEKTQDVVSEEYDEIIEGVINNAPVKKQPCENTAVESETQKIEVLYS